MTPPPVVIWHDLECGGYREDLALWRELADRHGAAVLDIGAGTGRVTLDLARAGHPVTALDQDPQLLEALTERAAGLDVTPVLADARAFSLPGSFALCIVPMQTVQLLGGAVARRAFLSCVRPVLAPGGIVAMAIADAMELFDVEAGFPAPLPDVTEIDGTVYCSRPTAVREVGDGYLLERRRETVTATGALTTEHDAIHLDRLTVDELQDDGRAVGLRAAAVMRVPPTPEYVGSTVVVLGA